MPRLSSLTFTCREGCGAVLALGPDPSYVPKDWTCPSCLSALDAQQKEAAAHEAEVRRAMLGRDIEDVF